MNTPDEAQMLDAISRWLERDVRAKVRELEHEDVYPEAMVEQMKEFGLFGATIPQDYGGLGLPASTYARIVALIAEVWMSLTGIFNSHLIMAAAVARYGTEEQKRRFLPKFASGEIRGGLALTEPDCGTDLQAIRTRAVRAGDGYVINGTKTWISNAPVADAGIVFAYTDRAQKHKGMSAFYVDLNQPGVARRTLEKMGAHASPTGELSFDNVAVPEENRIGPEGEGFKICMTHLNHTRLTCAAGGVGLARAAREAAVAYANQREQVGQKIGQFQMNQDLIAQMVVHEESARVLVWRAAALADQGRPHALETTIAKYSAAEAAAFNADAALRILGAYGYSTEFPVERYLRDAKSYQIVEGSSNILKLIIAQDALGYRKANR